MNKLVSRHQQFVRLRLYFQFAKAEETSAKLEWVETKLESKSESFVPILIFKS